MLKRNVFIAMLIGVFSIASSSAVFAAAQKCHNVYIKWDTSTVTSVSATIDGKSVGASSKCLSFDPKNVKISAQITSKTGEAVKAEIPLLFISKKYPTKNNFLVYFSEVSYPLEPSSFSGYPKTAPKPNINLVCDGYNAPGGNDCNSTLFGCPSVRGFMKHGPYYKICAVPKQ